MSNHTRDNSSDGTVCPSCHRTLPANARFCGFDGTPIRTTSTLKSIGAAPDADIENRKVCPLCGKSYPAHAVFCAVDAGKLIMPVRSPAAQATLPPSHFKAPPEPAQASAQPDGGNTKEVTDPPAQRKKKTTAKNKTLPPKPAKPTQLAEERSIDDQELSITSNLVGKTVGGKYLIESVLGEGGMAIVYRANHNVMERTVVIKIMQSWLMTNKNAIERFQRECKLTAKLNHPNIIHVYDVGFLSGNEPYLVMEYIQGESLGDKIARQGALPPATACNIIIQICRGLQEAHNAGIIHRDLKPDNILLQDKTDRPDWVKIVDFGISHLVQGNKRLTKTGKMVGTPEYIAPEQLKDKPIDIRTDLYGMGIILFEMLTGRVPFEGESAESILMKHLLEPPPPLSQYRDEFKSGSPFEAIIDKALRKNPDERYQTATEFRLEVEQALNKILLRRGGP